ncbi:pyrroloquinoline quinone biosynthesis protein PqqF [Pseudomonas entomophila]|uniref:pyrroloquinoline quinone biosynthesis protein PqqF n=1 Tax=Pseudomonas entomophila TaxID=312306 RepID=UPI001BD06B35|nr:pyrroloquinoline quinone biosynthesis protein PqqF [Pseudomonas entomophila]QVM91809.1 pyrroloquinoline quinone biosynthesis protein PqqF [Pseudomonas entomophila]
MPDTLRHLTLANGLQLTLRHAPRLKRAAAALRVHAGSHDAPAKWPGLAHFLEHLFFLGTARFPLEDGLMRHVQSLGGQVNASTRERTTDFFFEVPPSALAGALERLCQMLAEPDLGRDRQHREREVIHAEFIAWSRNREAQHQFALLQSVSPRHPLSGFHAGNRHSLPLQDGAFQRALEHFHRHFYQGGQITLSLAGPQSLDALEQLGRQFGELFAAGARHEQQAPPALLDGPLRPPVTRGSRHDLLFAHEGLPPAAEQALDLLLAMLNDSRPGGWLAELRQRGWLQGCRTQVLYAFSGQLLWHIQLQLSPNASPRTTQALLQGWLGFIRQQSLQQLNNAYSHLQQRREQAGSALDLARRDSTGQPFQGLDEQGLAAFGKLLEALQHQRSGRWQLPPAEPLLDASPAAGTAQPPLGLSIDNNLPSARQFAALYLRWHIPSPLRRRFQAVLERALQPLQERAERVSLQFAFGASGEYWQLRVAGQPVAVIRCAEEALGIMRAPATKYWHAPAAVQPTLIPIRTLLTALPNALLPGETQAQPSCLLDSSLLDALWQQARWRGLAVGFDGAQLDALGAALANVMGLPGEGHPPAGVHGRQWRQVPTQGSEPALLLFCPLPAALHACGRLLAHLLQGPVYQRLRVELQLGYAVFSAFRQVEGHCGLLFGVQSPHASHGQILDHLLTLLNDGVHLDIGARQQLAEQFDEAAMPNAEVAEWAWQAHMATQNPDLCEMKRSILSVEQPQLDALLQQLLAAEHGWLCLANAGAPDHQWQATALDCY